MKIDTSAGEYDIHIDTTHRHGYFEHQSLGDEDAGELTIVPRADGTFELTDYDGRFALPHEVVCELRRNKIAVPDSADETVPFNIDDESQDVPRLVVGA